MDDKNPVPAGAVEDADAVKEEIVVAEPEPEPEPEEITMTMDEYLASKSSKAAGDDLFGSKGKREIDTSEFSGKEAHVAVEGDFLVMGSGKSLRKRPTKKEAQKLEPNFRFASAGGDSRPAREENDDRRGGGRGDGGRGRGRRNDRRGDGRGRGGGRGGGRRSGGRGGGLKVDDANAFPSL